MVKGCYKISVHTPYLMLSLSLALLNVVVFRERQRDPEQFCFLLRTRLLNFTPGTDTQKPRTFQVNERVAPVIFDDLHGTPRLV